jgi:predicted transcriptional regulator
MSTEVTNEEPVLVLDDKKYVISELSDMAKYLVSNLNNLQMKIQNNTMEADQLRVAQEGLTAKLKEEVEKEPEEADISGIEEE